MRSLIVQIPQPCHERWADMQPTERGRFCASCQKTVVDYTTLSDQELVRLLGKESETSCGRFRDEQLNRTLTQTNKKTMWHHWIGLLTMGLVSWQTARAQSNPTNKSAEAVSVRPTFTVSTLPAKTSVSPEEKITIIGRVMLKDSSEHVMPAPQAHVWIALPDGNWHAFSDDTGTFSLLIPKHLQGRELTVNVRTTKRGLATVTLILPSERLIDLNELVVTEPNNRPVVITSGGIQLVRTPSRWQKVKQKLFH